MKRKGNIRYRLSEIISCFSFTIMISILIGTLIFKMSIIETIIMGFISSCAFAILAGSFKIDNGRNDADQKAESQVAQQIIPQALVDDINNVDDDVDNLLSAINKTPYNVSIDNIKITKLPDCTYQNDPDIDNDILENLGTNRH